MPVKGNEAKTEIERRERTMKGYSEWTSHSHLIAELPSRQQKRQPENQGDRSETEKLNNTEQ